MDANPTTSFWARRVVFVPCLLGLAAALGYLAGLFEARIALVLLYPIVGGFLLGLVTGVVAFLVRPSRSAGLLMAAGLALVFIVGLQTARKDVARVEFNAFYRAGEFEGVLTARDVAMLEVDNPLVGQAELDAAWKLALEEELGHSGPTAAWELTLDNGVRIIGGLALPLPPWGTALFWAFELLLAGLLIWRFVRPAVMAPRCESCRSWLVIERRAKCSRDDVSASLGLAADGEWTDIQAPRGRRPATELHLETCPSCGPKTSRVRAVAPGGVVLGERPVASVGQG